MNWQLGDVITNKMKEGPHFIIVEIDSHIIKCLQVDSPDKSECAFFSIEDM